jgi:hypothetical protein
MKIGSYTIRSPFTLQTESIQALDAGTAKGFFQPGKGTNYKPEDMASCFSAYENSDLIRAPIDDLVESACGLGHYNTVEKLSPVFQKNKSKALCDDFGRQFNLDSFLPNILRLAIIAGFCPVNTEIVQDVEKCALKIVHPKTVTDITTDPVTGEVLQIKQKVNNKEATITGGKLAWFTYGKMGNDPRGISLVRGILPLLNSLNKANDNVGLILDRYVAPVGIWKKHKSSAEPLKAAATTRGAGEDIFLGQLSDLEMTAKIVEFISIDPRVPFWEYIQDMKSQIFAYMRASNLWYEKDATLASDTALEQIIGRHVSSIQRELKRAVERYWYKPLCAANFSEDTEVPRINFGMEPTGVEDITPSEIITKGMELGYINQHQFNDIMQQIGIKLKEETPEEKEAAKEQEEKEQKTVDEQAEEEPETGKTGQQNRQEEKNKDDKINGM